jgi:hypothetical protein
LKAIQSAKELLKHLTQKKSLKYSVLSCYAQMCSKSKQDIDESMQALMQIMNQDRNYVPALLGKFFNEFT